MTLAPSDPPYWRNAYAEPKRGGKSDGQRRRGTELFVHMTRRS